MVAPEEYRREAHGILSRMTEKAIIASFILGGIAAAFSLYDRFVGAM